MYKLCEIEKINMHIKREPIRLKFFFKRKPIQYAICGFWAWEQIWNKLLLQLSNYMIYSIYNRQQYYQNRYFIYVLIFLYFNLSITEIYTIHFIKNLTQEIIKLQFVKTLQYYGKKKYDRFFSK